MTKKKPGAVRGRPKGSGAGLDTQIGLRLPDALLEALDAEAEARAVERSVIIREILERWAKRRPKA